MLDLELVVAPTATGLDIVSLQDMKKHVRVSATNVSHDDELMQAIEEAADLLHGKDGVLNRTIFPCTWARYMTRFPCGPEIDWRTGLPRRGLTRSARIIQLPLPPLIEVVSISYQDVDGSSPMPELDSDEGYIVRTGDLVAEIELRTDIYWPTVAARQPRAVAITYRAGYTVYPPALRRLVKILAAHFFENKEATINDVRSNIANRKVEYGVEHLLSALRVPFAQDDWE